MEMSLENNSVRGAGATMIMKNATTNDPTVGKVLAGPSADGTRRQARYEVDDTARGVKGDRRGEEVSLNRSRPQSRDPS